VPPPKKKEKIKQSLLEEDMIVIENAEKSLKKC
jgi:hypothetical protein